MNSQTNCDGLALKDKKAKELQFFKAIKPFVRSTKPVV